MTRSNILVVRHLPPNLTNEEKEDFLIHFGAVHVKVISSKLKKSSISFAKFKTEEEATAALHQLHQLDVLGYPLTVEYAKSVTTFESLPNLKPTLQTPKEVKESSQKQYENFLHKLNTWNSSVDFTQPPPPHIKYQYPPPTLAVLTNITRALASVPKFYTQVLHLMNKMNLPSPFHSIFPEPDILKQHNDSQVQSSDITVEQEMNTSTEESEIESDEDSCKIMQDIVPKKRTLPLKTKRVKRPKFVKPNIVNVPTAPKTTTKTEEIFEKVDVEPTNRKIALVLRNEEKLGETSDSLSVSQERQNKDSSVTLGGFGMFFPPAKESTDKDQEVHDEAKTESTEKYHITSEELAANRIPSHDQKHLPVFKNYQPGIPSCRLYIKNLSKQVESRNLHFIYSKYIIPDEEKQGSMFDIRLMKEGRMKGQAFVTLQNVKQAQLALNETNGYILKDKPMVVQFARSAMPKSQ